MSGSVVIVTETGNGPYAERVTVGRHIVDADEPESLGGSDSGIAPYDFLMAGLGTCTAMTLRMYATRNRWSVDKIEVEVTHEKVKSADGSTIDRFERTIHLSGDLTEDQRARLMTVSEKCPVSQTLQRASLVVSRLSADRAVESRTSNGLRAEKVTLSAA